MTRWLGINGYRFKNVILNLAARAAPDLRLAQRLAGHRNINSTGIYTPETAIGVNLDVADNVLIPELNSRYGAHDKKELEDFYSSLTHPRLTYIEFKRSWLTRLLTELYGKNHQSNFPQDADLDYTSG